MRRMTLLKHVTLMTLLTGAAACESPEAARTRGGGPGADVQNRPTVVKMHEGSDPFWDTPLALEEKHNEALLDAARHARRQSLEP
jgi:hypothetical protein